MLGHGESGDTMDDEAHQMEAARQTMAQRTIHAALTSRNDPLLWSLWQTTMDLGNRVQALERQVATLHPND